MLSWAVLLLATVSSADVPLLPSPSPRASSLRVIRVTCADGSLRAAFDAAGEGADVLDQLDAIIATRFDLYAVPRTNACLITIVTDASGIAGAALPHHGATFVCLRWRGRFFDPDGFALAGDELARPLPISVVTSRWGERFHPVTGEHKTHEGVDYGAPEGTPVWAVADGEVVAAGTDPAAGLNLRVLHAHDTVSRYQHLSALAPGVIRGASVTRGQVIGYVGKTGRVTGPHLHFELIKWGRVTDPLEEERRPGERLSEFQRASFDTDTTQLRAALLKGQ